MKTTILFLILLFQITIAVSQKPYGEDEKHEYYSTNWGAWVTAPGNANISFSARLNRYDKKTKLYNWEVRSKSTRTPIAFEYKITNQVFTGAFDYSDAVRENDGYYATAIFDNESNERRIKGNGFSIYSTSKTTLYYQIRNVCYEFNGRDANCDVKNKTLAKVNTKQSINKQNETSSTSNSLSDEDLENLIRNNLKQHLKTGSFNYNDTRRNGVVPVDIQKLSVDNIPSYMYDELAPHVLYIYYYEPGSNRLFWNNFIDLNIDKVNSNGKSLLYLKRDMDNTYNPLSDYRKGLFLYDFGPNDQNFIELQNAIEALKNPNKNYNASSRQNAGVQNKGDIKQNVETKNKLANEINTLTKLKNNLVSEIKNSDVIKQNILDYFKEQNYPELKKVSNTEKAINVYYFNTEKTLFLYEDRLNNILEVVFGDAYIEMGKNFFEAIKGGEISYGKYENYHNEKKYRVNIDFKRDIKIIKLSSDFKILTPENYSTLDTYPRTTNVSWNEFKNATYYELIVEFAQGENVSDMNNATGFTFHHKFTTVKNKVAFDGVGSQVHRYRVIAKKNEQVIAETNWNYINFKR